MSTNMEYKGYNIEFHQDEYAESPRKDADHACTMVCWHRRYNLGDEQPKVSPLEYKNQLVAALDNWWLYKELEKLAERYAIDEDMSGGEYERQEQLLRDRVFEENYFHKPLYLYDHSGITISLGAFGCPWDSGQVGFIYISKERAAKEWPGSTPEDLEAKVSACMAAEVEEYDAYLTGDVWGYQIWKNGLEVEDGSCWGFFGFKHAEEAAKEAVDYFVSKEQPLKLQISHDEVEYMLKHLDWLVANFEASTGTKLADASKEILKQVLEAALNG